MLFPNQNKSNQEIKLNQENQIKNVKPKEAILQGLL